MTIDLPRTTARRALALLGLCWTASFGAGCVGKRVVIVDPEGGEVALTEDDDLDARLAGLQYDVRVDTVDFPIGAIVTVFVGDDPETVLEEGFAYEGAVQPNRAATVRITLPTGVSTLVACAGEDCAHRSPARTVTVENAVGQCPLVQFSSPRTIGSGTLTLGPEADSALGDGTCGPSFAVPVRVRAQLPEGTLLRLYVDGLPTASAEVTDQRADFGDVVLGVRGADTARLFVAIEGQPASCGQEFPRPLAVACPGASCRLDPPSATPWLSSAQDANPATSRLDLAARAIAPIESVGRTFSFFVDDSLADSTISAAFDGRAIARFDPIAIGSAEVRLQASCSSTAQDVRSTVGRYAVDIAPCVIGLSSPLDGRVFTRADDADGNLGNGLQTSASVTLAGTDCLDFRVAACGAVTSTPMTPSTGPNATTSLTLGTTGTQEVCAQARDRAGNLDEVRITVGVAADGPPRLAIVTPEPGRRVSQRGGPYAGIDFLADLVPASPTCEVDVEVDCSGLGSPVTLSVDGASSSAQATCVANAGSSLGGRARLPAVSLPVGPTAHSLVARQTVSGITGTSAAFAIEADCAPPTLQIAAPTCGGWVDARDDLATAPGVQAEVRVSSPNQPQVDVTLTLARASGSSTVQTSFASMLSPGATVHVLGAMDFGTNGLARLVASALDGFGNATVTPVCNVTVARSPSLTLTPFAVSTFDASNRAAFDCRPSTPQLDLTVAGTTTASSGSLVTVQVGSAAPALATVTSGAFSACLPAPNGASSIEASVTDTNGLDGVSGTASAAPLGITVVGVGY